MIVQAECRIFRRAGLDTCKGRSAGAGAGDADRYVGMKREGRTAKGRRELCLATSLLKRRRVRVGREGKKMAGSAMRRGR